MAKSTIPGSDDYEHLRLWTGERVVAFSPALARALGGIYEALFLQQIAFWTPRAKDRDGWVYKTGAEIAEETALNRYQQDKARATLRQLGVLEEKRKGVPARMHYRIRWPDLHSLLTVGKQECAPAPHKMGDGEHASSPAVGELDCPPSGIKHVGGEQTISENTSAKTTETNEEDLRPPANRLEDLQRRYDEQERFFRRARGLGR